MLKVEPMGASMDVMNTPGEPGPDLNHMMLGETGDGRLGPEESGDVLRRVYSYDEKDAPMSRMKRIISLSNISAMDDLDQQ